MPFELIRKHEFEFAVYLPDKFSTGADLPVVVFLHGFGERGDDPWAPLKVIGHYCWQSQVESIVIFPQCDLQHRGFFGSMERRVLDALNTVRDTFALSEHRRASIAGFSMGGAGALWLNARFPGLFESVTCIAPSISWTGQEPPAMKGDEAELFHKMFCDEKRTEFIAQQFVHSKLMLVHGAHDDLVPIEETRELHRFAQQTGAETELIEVNNIGHESLEPALYEFGIFDWMLSKAPSLRKPACSELERRAS